MNALSTVATNDTFMSICFHIGQERVINMTRVSSPCFSIVICTSDDVLNNFFLSQCRYIIEGQLGHLYCLM